MDPLVIYFVKLFDIESVVYVFSITTPLRFKVNVQLKQKFYAQTEEDRSAE
jgi:hypothetical protein